MKFEKSEWTDDFDKYREIASKYMKRYYFITWDEAAGDPEPIMEAIEAKMTPTEFVDWQAEKYGLSSVDDDTGSPFAHVNEFLKDFGDLMKKSPHLKGIQEKIEHHTRSHKID